MTSRGNAILVVAYHFAPDTASGTHRSLHFARALVQAGYDVHVLTRARERITVQDPSLETVFPWPERVTRVDSESTLGDWYRGFKRARKPDSRPSSDPPTEPSPTPPNRSGPIGWLRAQLSELDAYPDLERGWSRPALRAGRRLFRSRGFAAVLVSGPPWTALVVAERLAREAGASLIADFRDPWTRSLGRTADPYSVGWANRRAEHIVGRVVREADLVLFNTPQVMDKAAAYVATSPSQRRMMILNGTEAPRSEADRVIPPLPPLRLRHFGSAYQGRSVKAIVAALEHLAAQGELNPGDVTLEFIGALQSDIDVPIGKPYPWGQVSWTERVPYRLAVSSMQEPAVLLVLQPPNFNLQVPTKLYEYLAAGNPLLVSAAEDSAVWSVARQFPWSRRLDPVDSAQVTSALSALVGDWRAGRLRAVRTVEATAHLTKAALDAAFVQAVGMLLSRRGEPSAVP